MKKLLICFISILTLCGCTVSDHTITPENQNIEHNANWPTTINSLIITNEDLKESLLINVEEPKQKLMWTFTQSKKIDHPEIFESKYTLEFDGKVLEVDGDYFYFDNNYYYKNEMELIWSYYFSNDQFLFQNDLTGIKTNVNLIELRWLENSNPYMMIQFDEFELINMVINELNKMKVEKVNQDLPQYTDLSLNHDDIILLQYNFNFIKLGDNCYRVKDSLSLNELLWDSEKACTSFNKKIVYHLLNENTCSQVITTNEIVHILTTEHINNIVSRFQIIKHMKGAKVQDKAFAAYELKVVSDQPLALRLKFLDSQWIEVNDTKLFLKYDSNLWDYLIETFPTE